MTCSSWKLLASIGLLALAACSEADDSLSASPEMAGPETISTPAGQGIASSDASAPASGSADIPVALPRMAYIFDYGFRLVGDAIAPLQQKHADMCETQGPYTCRIVSLSRTGEDDEIRGELQLAVASDKARAFATQLSDTAVADGAEQFQANITGEDLSKSIVDTEARLRSRIALRDRLMEVLETRKGTVEELVEAERGVAAVNEEIDAARSWLAEQRGRVAYSRMTLTYESATPGGSFLKPIEGAVGALGSVLGSLIAVLIVLGAIGVPLVLGALGVRRLRRRFGEQAEA